MRYLVSCLLFCSTAVADESFCVTVVGDNVTITATSNWCFDESTAETQAADTMRDGIAAVAGRDCGLTHPDAKGTSLFAETATNIESRLKPYGTQYRAVICYSGTTLDWTVLRNNSGHRRTSGVAWAIAVIIGTPVVGWRVTRALDRRWQGYCPRTAAAAGILVPLCALILLLTSM